MGVDAAMFVRTKHPLTSERVRRLSYELASAVGYEYFLMIEKSPHKWCKPQHALSIIEPTVAGGEYEYEADLIGKVVWHQDGDPIIAAADEQFIRVNLCGRYYGPGYERGDFPTLFAIGNWLRVNINGEVWYGGDSSGICAEPFDPAGLFAHWVKLGRRPYTHHFSMFRSAGTGLAGTTAPLCTFCDVQMVDCGGSNRYDFFACDGCGKKAVVFVDDQPTIWGTARDDFFELTRNIMLDA